MKQKLKIENFHKSDFIKEINKKLKKNNNTIKYSICLRTPCKTWNKLWQPKEDNWR